MTATSSEPVSSAPATPPPPPASRWEDFIDIFYAPAAVFRRRENQSVWPPMLVIGALIFVVTFTTFNALFPLIDIEMQRGFAKAMHDNPQFTPAMAATSEKYGALLGQWGAVFSPVYMLILGMAAWLIGKLVGSRQTLQAALVVATYTTMITVIELLANGIQALVFDVSKFPSIYALQVGPARFFDPVATSPLLFALLVRLNLFAVWRTVLLAIGWRVTGKVSWASATIAAVIIWGLALVWQYRAMLNMH